MKFVYMWIGIMFSSRMMVEAGIVDEHIISDNSGWFVGFAVVMGLVVQFVKFPSKKEDVVDVEDEEVATDPEEQTYDAIAQHCIDRRKLKQEKAAYRKTEAYREEKRQRKAERKRQEIIKKRQEFERVVLDMRERHVIHMKKMAVRAQQMIMFGAKRASKQYYKSEEFKEFRKSPEYETLRQEQCKNWPVLTQEQIEKRQVKAKLRHAKNRFRRSEAFRLEQIQLDKQRSEEHRKWRELVEREAFEMNRRILLERERLRVEKRIERKLRRKMREELAYERNRLQQHNEFVLRDQRQALSNERAALSNERNQLNRVQREVREETEKATQIIESAKVAQQPRRNTGGGFTNTAALIALMKTDFGKEHPWTSLAISQNADKLLSGEKSIADLAREHPLLSINLAMEQLHKQ